MKKSILSLRDLFFKLIYGCYEDEPVESTFKNLSKFTKTYGKYRLVDLILPTDEVKKFVDASNKRLSKLPEGNATRVFLEILLDLLLDAAFIDELELLHDAVNQRVKRVELKSMLGHWANGKVGKRKLRPHIRKKYENMLKLWDKNRMRRSNIAYIVMSIKEFMQADGIIISDNIVALSEELTTEAFAPAGAGRRGYLYDYMTDENKLVVKNKVDNMFMAIIDDAFKHLGI